MPRRSILIKAAFTLLMILLVTFAQAPAQPADSDAADPAALSMQPRWMVDFPTAGLPPKAGFYIEADIYSEGGMLLYMGVGFARYFSFGVSYGGLRVIGTGEPEMNPRPGVQLRARLIEESLMIPAIAIGYDSQGRGAYLDSLDRYLLKSRGIYAVASKNWDLLGPFSLHGGLSYSLEDDSNNKPTIFFGLIKNFSGFLDIRAEYDFALNDDWSEHPEVADDGILNASLVWHINDSFSIGVEVRDILTGNRVDVDDLREWNRGINIVYRGIL
jgi:hypothetical protein